MKSRRYPATVEKYDFSQACRAAQRRLTLAPKPTPLSVWMEADALMEEWTSLLDLSGE
jgi:hypothetical protein